MDRLASVGGSPVFFGFGFVTVRAAGKWLLDFKFRARRYYAEKTLSALRVREDAASMRIRYE